MRKFLRFLLAKPLIWFADYLSKAPKPLDVYKSLSNLYNDSNNFLLDRLKIIDVDDQPNKKFIVFSDQHKGNRSWADDFNGTCEQNYLNALKYYYDQGFTFINLGDSEELWKFNPQEVIDQNDASLTAESAFGTDRYIRTFGNHDIIWKNPVDVKMMLSQWLPENTQVYEGVVLKYKVQKKPLNIFLTHGHQGDIMSDNNGFSTWVIAHIWMPLQRYLRININSPSKDFTLRNRHNQLMYDWSSRKSNLLLITGHTHQPVFASGKYLDHPSNNIQSEETKKELKPSYFNTGCCCFNDGDITGIEIENNSIRLIKWFDEGKDSRRIILEENSFENISNDLRH